MIGQGNTRVILNISCPNSKTIFFGDNPYIKHTMLQPDLTVEKSYKKWASKNDINTIQGYVALNSEDLFYLCTQLFTSLSEAKKFYLDYIDCIKECCYFYDDLYQDLEFCFPIFEENCKDIVTGKYKFFDCTSITEQDIKNLKLPKLNLKDHSIQVAKLYSLDDNLDNKMDYKYISDFVDRQINSYNKYQVYNKIAGNDIFNLANIGCIDKNNIKYFLYPFFDNCVLYCNYRYMFKSIDLYNKKLKG